MLMRPSPVVFQVCNVGAVVAVLVMNTLVNVLPLNGVTTAQVSDSYFNLFTPPGYVFAIWGVIYTLAVVFMFYQVRKSERWKPYLQQINFLYPISALANITWLFLFQYSYGVPQLLVASLVPMTVLLISLLAMYVRLGIGRLKVPRNEKLALHLPISVYVGWISLAIIANIASALNVLIPGIPMSTQALWTVLVVFVALVISSLMVWNRGDIAFGIVVVWGTIGIALNRVAIPVIYWTALATAAVIAILILATPFLKKTGFINFYITASSK
jgi:benzodiazapine receptor